MPPTPRRLFWGAMRAILVGVGCKITQDGTGEGCALFDPANKQQAKAAIKCARIRTKKVLSEAHREKLVAHLKSLRTK